VLLASLRGVVVRGPVTAEGHAFALTRDWLGPQTYEWEDADRRTALGELARRYLIGHGPAGPRDLATWSGLSLRDARAGFDSIRAELTDAEPGVVDLSWRSERAVPAPPRLLPAFDPYLLGWHERGFAVPEAYRRRVAPGGGMLRATATADGSAIGTWSISRRAGRGAAIRIDPFTPPSEAVMAALRDDADDVAEFEGGAPRRG
jgi:hypothetical protein